MLTLLTILLIITNNSTFANFTPHMISKATTLPQYKLALETTPGGRVGSNFLISSLSIGVLDRVQIGTIPIFYIINGENHKYNFNIKYNFFKSSNTSLAIGYTRIKFKLDSKQFSSFQNPPTSYYINLTNLALNYLIPNSSYGLGFEYVIGTSYANNSALVSSYEASDTWGLDIMKKINSKITISLGIGDSQTEIAPTDDSKSFGYGLSTLYIDQFHYFSNPSIGIHYFSDANKFLGLFTADFY